MELSRALGCFAAPGCLEMPAWNGHSGSGPLREPGGAAGMGGVDLVGISGISHCPLENDLYFTSFSFPAAAFSVRIFQVVRFCDQYLGCGGVWMERLDGMDSEDLYIFFLLPVSKCSFLTIDCGFGLSFSLFLFLPVRTWRAGTDLS